MTTDRYWLSGDFGSRAAINSTSACRDCGAVVWNEAEHDAWHAAISELVTVTPPARARTRL